MRQVPVFFLDAAFFFLCIARWYNWYLLKLYDLGHVLNILIVAVGGLENFFSASENFFFQIFNRFAAKSQNLKITHGLSIYLFFGFHVKLWNCFKEKLWLVEIRAARRWKGEGPYFLMKSFLPPSKVFYTPFLIWGKKSWF